ncbi:MAG: hypothetical protein V3W44_06590, partial [Dehalococcoidales bacterium]
WRNLRYRAKRLPGSDTTGRKAVASALRYIRTRKAKMRTGPLTMRRIVRSAVAERRAHAGRCSSASNDLLSLGAFRGCEAA